MQTLIVKADENNINADDMLKAGRIIREGGLVAFPTETVYGLGGDALNPEASEKIYAAKGRPSDNPLIVHIYRMEDLYKVAADVSDDAVKLAGKFWPHHWMKLTRLFGSVIAALPAFWTSVSRPPCATRKIWLT